MQQLAILIMHRQMGNPKDHQNQLGGKLYCSWTHGASTSRKGKSAKHHIKQKPPLQTW